MKKACSSVDRASDSDSESRGFDSLHAYRIFKFRYKKKYFLQNFLGADLVSTFKNGFYMLGQSL